MLRYSILDLSPIIEGGDAAQAFRNTADLAQHAEKWGYHRFWLAEHHNLGGIASAATSVVIGHVAGVTERIRVGAGGIMLPNHAPLVIAEQFGTLGVALSWPHRSGIGSRAGERSTDRPRPAPKSRQRRRYFPAGPTRVANILPSGRARTTVDSPFPAQASTCRFIFWARVTSAPAWRPSWDCRLPLPRISPRNTCAWRSLFTAATSGLLRHLDKPYVIIGAGVYAAENEAEARHRFLLRRS